MVDALAAAADAMSARLQNADFDIERNGESRVLRAVCAESLRCLFDVGANRGEWSLAALGLAEGCPVHAFEILPETCGILRDALRGYPSVRVNAFGLGERSGTIDIHVPVDDAPATATAFPVSGHICADGSAYYKRSVECTLRTGADYVIENGIDSIDFMKIDVEGMELRVIKGFGETLDRVRAIQFEYGIFNIGSRDLLIDFFEYLNRRGFVVGKIYPRTVEFFDYSFERESFVGCNYVAVRRSEGELIRRLAAYSR